MEKFDWKATIKVNIYCLWLVGLWPEDDTGYKFNFYSTYATISINFFISVLGILAAINSFMVDIKFEDSEELTLYFIGEILAHIKIYMFVKNMTLLKQLVTTLNNGRFQPKCLRQRLLIEPALNFWKMVYNAFTASGGPVISLWVLLPLLNKSRELPLSFWYPYNTKTSLVYEMTYLHQVVSIFYTLIAVYNIDMLIAALMVFIGAQCDILSDNLRSLQANTAASFNKKLINSIKHHQEILSFAKNCNQFFNVTLLGQFLASSVILSLILYRLALDKNVDIKFCAHVVLVAFYMIQIFTYCWFGNEVEIKSNQIPYSIFESEWTHYALIGKEDMMTFITYILRFFELLGLILLY
ncbi:7tm 6 domain containing protein [Asbolus verrucosus]|uniref:Odorant receptor n=1 Tax=Asbolus verrucosus TaxID=1661398 RepID=A0A482VUV6_ASBVE|nr:7tm 6 domain containing protein [Asbolus verrucosus]